MLKGVSYLMVTRGDFGEGKRGMTAVISCLVSELMPPTSDTGPDSTS